MTRRPVGSPGPTGGGGEEFARAEALAGLAREVDGLRRSVDPLAGVSSRVDDLARTLAQLADVVAAAPGRAGPAAAPSWLAAEAEDREVLAGLLDGLCGWLQRVFLRYPDAASVLPECCLFHPDVVEELLWLSVAWRAAYEGKGASVQAAGDWHDRQRPGVVRRLKTTVGSCSIERHQTRAGWTGASRAPVAVPGRVHAEVVVAWWAHDRDRPAPEPESATAPAGARTGPRSGPVPGFHPLADAPAGAGPGRWQR